MENILKQQQITNSRLLRLENRSIELRNVLEEIFKSISLVADSSSSVKELITVSVGSLEKLEDISVDNSKQLAISNISDNKGNANMFDMVQSGIQIIITKLEDISNALMNYSGIPMTYGAQSVASTEEEQREMLKIDQRQVTLLEHIAEKLGTENDVAITEQPKEDGGFLGTITKMLGAVGGFLAPLLKNLPKMFGNLFDMIGNGLRKALGVIFSPAKILTGLAKRLGPVAIVGSLISGISDAIETYDPKDSISEMIPKVIKSFFGGVLEFLSFGTLGKEEVEQWFSGLSDWVSLNLIEPVMNFFTSIGEKLTSLKLWWDEFDMVGLVSNGINDITNKITKAFEDVVKWFSDLTIGGVLKTLGVDPKIADSAQQVYDTVTNATSDAAEATAASTQRGLDFLSDTFGFSDNLNDALGPMNYPISKSRDISPIPKTPAEVPNGMSSEMSAQGNSVTVVNNYNTNSVNAPSSTVVAGRPASNSSLPKVLY